MELLLLLIALFSVAALKDFILKPKTTRKRNIHYSSGEDTYSESINSENNSNLPEFFPYRKKYLLTKAEYSFYGILRKICETQNILICPKVRLEDIVEVTTKENILKYRGYIRSRHIDFLLCDNKLHVIAAIELDDNTHKTNKKVIATDEFKDKLFNTINIPLFRVIMSEGSYETQIYNILNNINNTANTPTYNS